MSSRYPILVNFPTNVDLARLLASAARLKSSKLADERKSSVLVFSA